MPQATAANPRISLGQHLIRLGNLVESLAVAVMRPRDLVEWSRRGYSSAQAIEGWCSPAVVEPGLRAEETMLLGKIPQRRGRLLLLGLGGGREAIPLARMGFEVTGVDFVPDMVRRAATVAAQHGVKLDTLVQDMAQLDVPPASFDVVWISTFMYSVVPTRKDRVRMLRRIASALKPGGSLICQFWWDPRRAAAGTGEAIRRAVAFLTLSNPSYQKGDTLRGQDFIHVFSVEGDLRSEFKDGGFEAVYLQLSSELQQGRAVLREEAGAGHLPEQNCPRRPRSPGTIRGESGEVVH